VVAESGRAAVDNANGYTAYDVGMCLQWVRGPCWGIGAYFGSAIDAWHGARDRHPGDRHPPVGAALFYRGGNYGHVVIAKPNAAGMRSTDCRSAGVVGDEAIGWIEQHWGYEYLGWTGDLNGVDLPLGGAEDEEMELADKMDEWSPADGTSKDQVTVGYTLRQARGYAEDGYQRVGKLAEAVEALQADVREILRRLG
jgi:hypothetical protein